MLLSRRSILAVPHGIGYTFPVPNIWIIFNAWKGPDGERNGDDWISEAEVEEEVEPVAASLEALGIVPAVYPLSSVSDLLNRWEGSERPDLVFNLVEGYRGDAHKEMNVAALYELAGIPYTGNPARTLALAQDKALAKRLFAAEGIPTPAWAVSESGEVPDLSGLRFPLIAKPSRQDASLGIGADGVFRDRRALEAGIQRLHDKYREPILIEDYIEGREFNSAILETGGRAEALPLSEIRFDGVEPGMPRITSYEAKWLVDHPLYRGTPAVCPADVEAGLEARMKDLAIRTFRLLGGKDYGRVDFRLDEAGTPYVLEYNPNPDISLEGGFVRALKASGRTYENFTAVLLANNGQADRKEKP